MWRAFQWISTVALCCLVNPIHSAEPNFKVPTHRELIEQLHGKNPVLICEAAKVLGNSGPDKEAIPRLKELLKDRNCRVRWNAAEALWKLEHKPSELVPVFSELLTAQDEVVRAASAWRLGRLGSDAKPAVLLLAGALRDESFEVRVQAGQALANLAPHASAALPALVRALGDDRLNKADEAEKGWESARNSPVLPALIEMSDEAVPFLTVLSARSCIGACFQAG